ncbi:sulfotransferase domain-containing protein [Nitrosopumilus adriaticus]|uniref:sulfotransferase domain-containing protein n=1 Tax=Nitrosopumilus adriaticus TaxID=1580092 RepID=UPI00352EE21E
MKENKRNSIRLWLLRHPYFNPFGFNISRFFRTLTAPIRSMPDFLIIGYTKSGSTALYDYLIQHPNVVKAARKEIHFFDISYWRGKNWYRSYFPILLKNIRKSKKITGEASPTYIFHPFAMKRIKKIIPKTKLVIILRNPTDRAYSHFQNYTRGNNESCTFEEAISEEKHRFESYYEKFSNDKVHEEDVKFLKIPYLYLGLYHEHLTKLFEIFPKNQILILKNEDLENNTQKTLDEVFSFLSIPKYSIPDLKKRKVGTYDEMKKETRDFLDNFYKPHTDKLEKLLNTKFDWS